MLHKGIVKNCSIKMGIEEEKGGYDHLHFTIIHQQHSFTEFTLHSHWITHHRNIIHWDTRFYSVQSKKCKRGGKN